MTLPREVRFSFAPGRAQLGRDGRLVPRPVVLTESRCRWALESPIVESEVMPADGSESSSGRH